MVTSSLILARKLIPIISAFFETIVKSRAVAIFFEIGQTDDGNKYRQKLISFLNRSIEIYGSKYFASEHRSKPKLSILWQPKNYPTPTAMLW